MSDLTEDATRMGELPRAPRATGYATLTAEEIENWWMLKGGGRGICWQSEDEHQAEMRGEHHA